MMTLWFKLAITIATIGGVGTIASIIFDTASGFTKIGNRIVHTFLTTFFIGIAMGAIAVLIELWGS